MGESLKLISDNRHGCKEFSKAAFKIYPWRLFQNHQTHSSKKLRKRSFNRNLKIQKESVLSKFRLRYPTT